MKKYCENCVHFMPETGFFLDKRDRMLFAHCSLSPIIPEETNKSRISKELESKITEHLFCSTERSTFGRCGPEGTLFEQRPPEPPKSTIWQKIKKFCIKHEDYDDQRPNY